MGIFNKHQLKFNSIKDAKQLLEAVEKRFGGNAATKKTQRNLLKQQFEKFFAPRLEMLDQTFDRLQKLVSQLELLGEKISKENVKQKLLRSLSPEWNTHVVFTNRAVNAAHGVSTASTQVNAAFSTNIDNLSDVVICAFLASQLNSPQLAHEDLEQINPDDIKEMDLRWQMAMLTMRARRFLQKTGRKLHVNGIESIGFDKSKVEYYNCHKNGHFTREYKALRNQDNRTRKAQKGAEEGPNYALMAYTSSCSESKVSNDSTCSKTSLETVKVLKSQNEQLLKDLKKLELMVLGYKADYEEINEGYVAFVGNPKGGKITRKCTIKTDFKLFDESHVLLRVPKKNNMYSVDFKNIVLKGGLTCLFAKATSDESKLWHKRLGHLNFKAMNKLVKKNLVRVNTACYVQNRVLVVKPHNKTTYDLFHDRTPSLSFMRPFGCPVTILNTKYHLRKFDGNADDNFFIGYSLNSKAFRVFNSRTRIVEENLHIRFSENTPNAVGSRPDWLFNIDALTRTMNYKPVVTGTQSNGFADLKSSHDDGSKPSSDDGKKVDEDLKKRNCELLSDLDILALEDFSTFNFSSDHKDDDVVADMNNLDTTIQKEILQFKLQEVWSLANLPNRKRAIGTKWVFRNKKDERGIVIRNIEKWVALGHTQEERIDYDEVFAPVVRNEAIRLFLAYASFKYFLVYQMNVKSAFLYGKIEEEVYVCQPPGFEDSDFPDRVYKVEKALYN
nr:retrovirus-related Pol polyprotein from transposon TNT 1-94 [Tanacetum cinerariifolium]